MTTTLTFTLTRAEELEIRLSREFGEDFSKMDLDALLGDKHPATIDAVARAVVVECLREKALVAYAASEAPEQARAWEVRHEGVGERSIPRSARRRAQWIAAHDAVAA